MSTAAKSVATCCIVYTTDPTYLFPTLVSAMQAHLFSSRQKADVAVFCLHLDPATNAVFAPICAREGIHLIPLESDVVEGQSAMIARLFLTRFVPAHYTDYLYLDGDIHILDSLDPLLEFEVPDGCFLAANDPMTFLLADNSFLSRKLRGHLRHWASMPASLCSTSTAGCSASAPKAGNRLALRLGNSSTVQNNAPAFQIRMLSTSQAKAGACPSPSPGTIPFSCVIRGWKLISSRASSTLCPAPSRGMVRFRPGHARSARPTIKPSNSTRRSFPSVRRRCRSVAVPFTSCSKTVNELSKWLAGV